jgi:hypothetical protein
LDRYSTGEIPYYSSGSTESGWVKRGFVFITGPTQTSATFSIRNNSQGGGGNDWAMDDITVATCLPTMTYTPTLSPTVCQLNAITIDNKASSFFSNYTHYKWQRSTDGGSNWTDIAGQTGSATPTLVAGQYEYPTSYTIPPANTTVANNGDRYRLMVATTAANLSGSTCQITDGVSQINLSVITCAPVLGINFISFNGKIENGMSVLRWTTNTENNLVHYLVERSINGQPFEQVRKIPGQGITNNAINTYYWSEPFSGNQKILYRVQLVTANDVKTSRVVLLEQAQSNEAVVSIANPFKNDIIIDVKSPQAGNIRVEILDNNGVVAGTQAFTISAGSNKLVMNKGAQLPAGFYTIRMISRERVWIKKTLKL